MTAVVAVALGGGGYAAYASATKGPEGYRTAEVTRGDVESTLALSGTVAPGGRSDLAFGADGTVAWVAPEGAHVRKGQVVARLDRGALRRAVTEAQAEVDSARLRREQDEEAQTDDATAAPSSPESSSPQSNQPTGSQPSQPTGSQPSQPTSSPPDQQSSPNPTPSQSTPADQETGPTGTPSDSTATLVSRIQALQAKVTSAQTSLDEATKTLADANSSLDEATTQLATVVDAITKVAGDLGDDGDLAKALSQARTDCAASADGTGQSDAAACTNDLSSALSALGVAQTDVPDTGDGSVLATAESDVTKAETDAADAQRDVTAAQGDLSGYVAKLDALLKGASAGASGSSSQGTKGHSTTSSPVAQPSAQPSREPSKQPSQHPSQPSSQPSSQQPSRQGSKQSQSATPTASSTQDQAQDQTQDQTQDGASPQGETITAATLAQDQARIDQAKADLVAAREALRGATLRAPAAGTVAAVDPARGDAATAGSDVVTIVSRGLTSVEVEVSDTQVRQIKTGQKATITPAGSTVSYAGRVTRIGAVPDTSSGSTTYSVTVTLTRLGLGLLTGTTAAVDLMTGSVDGVLTVPTSAVSDGTVTVLMDGRPRRTRVTTGLVGRTRTQIVDGLTAGQQVVLADLSRPLPTGDDQSSRRDLGSPGGLGGPELGSGRVTFTR